MVCSDERGISRYGDLSVQKVMDNHYKNFKSSICARLNAI